MNKSVAKERARKRKHYFHPNDGKPNLGLTGDAKLPYVTLRALRYEHSAVRPIRIPAGFATDLASIPKLLTLLPGLDPLSPKWRCAIVHDFAYATHLTDRDIADLLLRSGLIQDGVPCAIAWPAWVLVRAFGWIRWNRVAAELDAEQEGNDRA